MNSHVQVCTSNKNIEIILFVFFTTAIPTLLHAYVYIHEIHV